ncbi:hypothetical protein SLS56_000455 [Neofusicoccum ribis]|uniref:Uncharacterized protein n=1 Tax=Neofusicoccum ribis TaxID=45134 RepID=A0ABR3TEA8_9PEZI
MSPWSDLHSSTQVRSSSLQSSVPLSDNSRPAIKQQQLSFKMRSALVLSGLVAIAAAAPAPAPQEIEFDNVIDAIVSTQVPTGTAAPTATYDAASALSSAAAQATADPVALSKRDAPATCPSSTDDAASFQSSSTYSSAASSAPCPSGYDKQFTALTGATTGSGYLTYYVLGSYDPSACAAKCDALDNCLGFNIFYERDPSVTPSDSCTNPASTTVIKCSVWGLPVSPSTATNVGQWSGPTDQWFHTVIAGSNGYNKHNFVPKTVDGFNGPSALKGATQASGYIGMRFFDVYDVSLCAKTCTETTAFDKAHIQNAIAGDSAHYAYDACNYFNVYVLSEGDKPTGMYCSMYTSTHTYDDSLINVGQWRGQTWWGVSDSYGYALTVQDSGVAAY